MTAVPGVDQAAGLRAWAATRGQSVAPTLVVVGDPLPAQAGRRARAVLEYWADRGWRWVGVAQDWRIVPLSPALPVPASARREPRWALWVEPDGAGLRRALSCLESVRRQQGPRRLLALHPPRLQRRGLLDNLQQAAWRFLDTDLVVLAP
ncbi:MULTISPECIES: hypothetical protein [Alloalcanivorax]|jgi:hypothetical protein|uniref:Uncharacterized protein n=1 Tax=Alloalcanivorax balearicus MACL04 TaxID=1177182 RepID=A0ABT2R3D6_9GAMM|nr:MULTISPECIES: hypothetical protein [Alloalcanivorax]ERS13401.1 hypothetical protein Q668_14885 [Alcanivorax sp. PN-3]KYZ87403.1 hypothetical protein A3Q32_12260 [Alcanivorax sp. KX64203]MBA4723265.1 hypothetical protein [Alcanivorax sp.]MCE7522615.1 hypothetical protein [Alloalcanivorax xenomutans]MCU5784274.1 hypothetical protein [Alloalcanivorax balearicus MACL04]|tara:strand:- start:54 stop:503 length:450 start_codon:yes stop_codon:yes gene_type:complete